MNENNERQLEQDSGANQFLINIFYEALVLAEEIDSIMRLALEDGIRHWCDKVTVAGKGFIGEPHEQIAKGGMLFLHDSKSGVTHRLTRDRFLYGLKTFLKDDFNINVNIENRRINMDGFTAECADCVIQYAVFSELMYG